MKTKISIIIPCLNEEKYISQCLDSVVASDYSKADMEVWVIDGISSDRTQEIVKIYIEKYSYMKLLINKDKIVPIAMNLGIHHAQGDYIIRIDAHSEFPKTYFSKLIHSAQVLNAENVGGIVKTEVKNENDTSTAIKAVLAHKFGVGNSDFRIGTKEIKEVDTVPFGCYPRAVFEKYGFYDERLVRNQDIELNKRILNGGGKIYLIPDVQCTYYARETFTALAKNSYANGYWNLLTAYYTKSLRSLSLRHFVPLLFVLSLLLPLLFLPSIPELAWIAVLSLFSYLSLVIIISLKIKNRTNSLFNLIGSFLTLHISYGLGSLMGLFGIINKFIKGEH